MAQGKSGAPAKIATVEEIIVAVRGERVILDHALARLYGVTTKALNQAVRRNRGRFPPDFVFQLTFQEVMGLRSQIVTSSRKENRSQSVTGSQRHRDPRHCPYAFTEHGALMAANVLRSPHAVEMSLYVIRAFVRLRSLLVSHRDLAHRLDELEEKYDTQFKAVFDAIRDLMAVPENPRRAIGFTPSRSTKLTVEERRPGYGRARPAGRRRRER